MALLDAKTALFPAHGHALILLMVGVLERRIFLLCICAILYRVIHHSEALVLLHRKVIPLYVVELLNGEVHHISKPIIVLYGLISQLCLELHGDVDSAVQIALN